MSDTPPLSDEPALSDRPLQSGTPPRSDTPPRPGTPAVPSRPASRQIGLSISVGPATPGPGTEDHVLTLGGELKARNGFAAADALAHAISEARGSRLVLDLSGVTFCDLSSVRMLDNARGVLREGGRTLVLRNPPAAMLELLQILGLAERFVVEQQVD